MKRQIRANVFETNSSSVHSITMCTESDYKRWKDGETYYNNHGGNYGRFVTKNEAVDILKKCGLLEAGVELSNEEFNEVAREAEFYLFEDYPSESFEWFKETFTSPGGDNVVAFGYYGHD